MAAMEGPKSEKALSPSNARSHGTEETLKIYDATDNGPADFAIQIGDKSFKVHKSIMVSVSDYFSAMLAGNMIESEKNEVHISGVPASAFKILLDFAYKGILNVNKVSATEVLDAAMYLQMGDAIQKCVKFIVDNINENDAITNILEMFMRYNLKDGIKLLGPIFRKHSETLLEKIDPRGLSAETVHFIIDNWRGLEIKLFVLVKNWIESTPVNHVHQNSLFSKLRFGLMSGCELKCIQNTDIFKNSSEDDPLYELVTKAFPDIAYTLTNKLFDNSEQYKFRGESRPTYFSCEEGSVGCFTLREDGEWLFSSEIGLSEESARSKNIIIVNNLLLIGEDRDEEDGIKSWYIFDPRTAEYEKKGDMQFPRTRLAAVLHNRKLYTFGGFPHPTIVEVCNLATESWRCINSLPEPRIVHAACVYKGLIYVSGGRGIEDIELDTVDCMDPETQVWSKKASMLQPTSYHVMNVMEIKGAEVMCVIHKNFHVEFYNATTDQWTWVSFSGPALPDPSFPEATCKGNRIFYADFHVDQDSYYCLEVQYPIKGKALSVNFHKHFYPRLDDSENDNVFLFGAYLTLPPHLFRPHPHTLLNM